MTKVTISGEEVEVSNADFLKSIELVKAQAPIPSIAGIMVLLNVALDSIEALCETETDDGPGYSAAYSLGFSAGELLNLALKALDGPP